MANRSGGYPSAATFSFFVVPVSGPLAMLIPVRSSAFTQRLVRRTPAMYFKPLLAHETLGVAAPH